MNNQQFVIVLDGSSYKPMYEHMLMDLSELDNVTFVIEKPHKSIIKQLLLKQKVQYLTKGYLDFLAYEERNLYLTLKQVCESHESVIVVFLNATLNYYPYLYGTLKKYKKIWKGLKYVLFYLDIVKSSVSENANRLRKKGIFDLIYSIDEEDAEQINCLLWRTIYSVNQNYKGIESVRDLYFCGVSKNRSNILSSCAEGAIEHCVSCEMDVICAEDADLLNRYKSVINVRKKEDYMSYTEVLRKELESSCLLDVVQNGQVALTLRPYEAVVYNRKLLSNNKSIFNFSYYNEKYMRYFENVEDIDWEWVKTNEKINYGYMGDFSPVLFLEDIGRRLSQINHIKEEMKEL